MGGKRIPFCFKAFGKFGLKLPAGFCTGAQLLIFCSEPLRQCVHLALECGLHTLARLDCPAINLHSYALAAQFGCRISRLKHFPRGTQVVVGDEVPQAQFIGGNVRKTGVGILESFNF